MFVKPIAGGHDVLDPHTRTPVPSEGREVPESVYWMRRLRDGDLELAKPPPPMTEAAAPGAGGPDA